MSRYDENGNVDVEDLRMRLENYTPVNEWNVRPPELSVWSKKPIILCPACNCETSISITLIPNMCRCPICYTRIIKIEESIEDWCWQTG